MPAITNEKPDEVVAPANFDLAKIRNLDRTLNHQVEAFNKTRERVRGLKFVKVGPAGTYATISYKAIDGGKLGIYFDPFEVDLVKIADSYGNEAMGFLTPTNENLNTSDFEFLNDFPEIQNMLRLFQVNSVVDLCHLLQSADHAMELAEFACIFDKMSGNVAEPALLMKDGLLRNNILRTQYKQRFYEILNQHKKQKLVGVAKRSRVLEMIGAALWAEGIIPSEGAGYVEIPQEIEAIAYKWHQEGTLYQYGKLYVGKFSPKSDLLVVVEIPYNFEKKETVYTVAEVEQIMEHLVKDSQYSFPTIGYPQTIMRAHEKAVATGFTASIWRDLIMDELLEKAGAGHMKLQGMLKERWLLKEQIKNSDLGGI